MIINTEKGNITTTFQTNEKFKIAPNPIAMQVLSSKIYSDPVSSIIRELSSNAVDAHIAAGTSHIPYDVYLPNMLHSRFCIRDYGTGMSHEDIMNVFISYFESSKRDTNDYVGGFGLGCKTPFSYASSFTITSYHNNICRIYSAYKDEHDYPLISLVSEEQTIEHNGLKIEFPVKTFDYSLFNLKAEAVYQWFDHKPNILCSEINKKEFNRKLDIYHENNDYIIYNDKDNKIFEKYSYNSNVYIKHGNACYKVDLNLVKNYISDNEHSIYLTGINQLLDNLCIVLKMPVGSITLAASRESIHYNEYTIKNISMHLIKVVKDLVQYLDNLINQKKTSNEKRIIIIQFSNLISKMKFNQFIPLLIKCGLSNNPNIEELMKPLIIDMSFVKELRIVEHRKHNKMTRYVNKNEMVTKIFRYVCKQLAIDNYFMTIVIDDMPSNGLNIANKARDYLFQDNNLEFFVFSFIDKKYRDSVYYKFITENVPHKIVTTSFLAKELNLVKNKNVQSGPRAKPTYMSNICDYSNNRVLKNTKFKNAFYIYKYRNEYFFNKEFNNYCSVDMLHFIHKYFTKNIYFIASNFNLDRHQDLRPISEILPIYQNDLIKSLLINDLISEKFNKISYIMNNLQILHKDELLMILKSYDIKKDYNGYYQVIRVIIQKLGSPKINETLSKLEDNIRQLSATIMDDLIKKYPLLDIAYSLKDNSYLVPIVNKEKYIKEYIELVNKNLGE